MRFLKNEIDLTISKEPTVLFFYLENYPFFNLIVECKFKNLILINIKDFPTFIKRFSLVSVPTFIFFKNKKEKKRTSDVIMFSGFTERYIKND